jgi:hypothetical protein
MLLESECLAAAAAAAAAMLQHLMVNAAGSSYEQIIMHAAPTKARFAINIFLLFSC